MNSQFDTSFESAWLKWAWAVIHADRLRDVQVRLANRAYGDPLFVTRAEYKAKRHGFGIIVDQIDMLIPAETSLILGDVGTNFRAALDHLAWAVVSRGKTPPGTPGVQQNQIYFPISNNNKLFNKTLAAKLPGATRADIAKIRRYQPFARVKRGMHWSGASLKYRVPFQALSVLARLNNLDKHRQVQPVLALPVGGELGLIALRDCALSTQVRRLKPVSLEVGAELHFVPVRKTGRSPEMEVRIMANVDICLDNGLPVVKWAVNTAGWIRALLLEFSSQPDSKIDALPGWKELQRK